MATLQEPKRPATAYFLFVNSTREQIQKELGDKSFGPVTKAQAERWKNMPAATKATYEKQAADAKVKFEKDVVAYKEAGGVVGQAKAEKKEAKQEKADKKAKKIENADKPKAPAGGAFGVWLKEIRPEIMKSLPAGSKCTAVAPVASLRWKAMNAQDKKPWEEKYQVASAKYKEEIKAWKEAKGDAADDGDEAGGDDAEDVEPVTEAKTETVTEKAAPKKRSADKTSSPPPKKAKGKGRGKGAAAAAQPEKETINPDVLQKASSLGLDRALKILAARDGMSDISGEKMLTALQQAGGLVNKAKVALLAGA